MHATLNAGSLPWPRGGSRALLSWHLQQFGEENFLRCHGQKAEGLPARMLCSACFWSLRCGVLSPSRWRQVARERSCVTNMEMTTGHLAGLPQHPYLHNMAVGGGHQQAALLPACTWPRVLRPLGGTALAHSQSWACELWPGTDPWRQSCPCCWSDCPPFLFLVKNNRKEFLE
jgi:hypothetical protein